MPLGSIGLGSALSDTMHLKPWLAIGKVWVYILYNLMVQQIVTLFNLSPTYGTA